MDPPGLRAQGALVTAGVWASSAGVGDHVSPREAGRKETRAWPPRGSWGWRGTAGAVSSHRLQGWKASAGLPWAPLPARFTGTGLNSLSLWPAKPDLEPVVRFLDTSKAGPLSKTR